MLYHAFSLLLSSCASCVRVAVAGEVAKNKGQFLFHYLWKHNYCSENPTKLYPTVPLFVATFMIHADDDNNPLFSPILCVQLIP